jgi:hypothetical protein
MDGGLVCGWLWRKASLFIRRIECVMCEVIWMRDITSAVCL